MSDYITILPDGKGFSYTDPDGNVLFFLLSEYGQPFIDADGFFVYFTSIGELKDFIDAINKVFIKE